ncbi:hypothetical protein RhiirA4_464166 [Rhizophagus irregularis]|uniref:Galactose oxidase n=1 Tax=Rhizophagus irregularis TaxID=588596 RepID=A0A2I1GPH3_9GLOM|nr:hypothetical protein RhiirA4_464166 [Rhizophagus irregularis]
MVPLHGSATSTKGGTNNDTLFLYGGFSNDPTMALVYTFDSQHIVWNPQKITGIDTINRKYKLTGVMGFNGKFYLWGGGTDNGIVNDMLILNTINLNWEKGSLVNAPAPRYNYGATLLPNNKIIYMGGQIQGATYNPNTLIAVEGVTLTLSEVYIYDMTSDSWDTKITSGEIPSNRCCFSTVLGLDGQRIIIYGGIFNNPGFFDTTLYVLNLANYSWYIPKISGKIPKSRILPKANVIGKYMVISFGDGYDRTVENDLLLLDISNNEEYIWTTQFDPKNDTTVSPPPPNNIVGVIVGSILSVIFLSVGGFFIYKWNKNKQNQKTINENNNRSNYSQEEKDNDKQEIIQMPRNENTTNHEPVIVPANDYHGQEIIQMPRNENTTNHEPVIVVPANDYHGQEIMQTPKNGNSTNNEPIIPAPAVASDNNNYNYGQEVISTSNNGRLSSQILKDEILQAVKQEIKNELLQAVRDNNFDITKKK